MFNVLLYSTIALRPKCLSYRVSRCEVTMERERAKFSRFHVSLSCEVWCCVNMLSFFKGSDNLPSLNSSFFIEVKSPKVLCYCVVLRYQNKIKSRTFFFCCTMLHSHISFYYCSIFFAYFLFVINFKGKNSPACKRLRHVWLWFLFLPTILRTFHSSPT